MMLIKISQMFLSIKTSSLARPTSFDKLSDISGVHEDCRRKLLLRIKRLKNCLKHVGVDLTLDIMCDGENQVYHEP